jgi:hypothetical protein
MDKGKRVLSLVLRRKMMKKVLFVVMSLLIASFAFAEESAPSEEVGYVKVTATANGQFHIFGVQSTASFGLPFKFWDVWSTATPLPPGTPIYGVESTKPSDVFGTQTVGWNTSTFAEKIVSQGGSTGFYRTGSGWTGWSGTLESGSTLLPGFAYWFVTHEGTARSIIVAGHVDNSGNYGTRSITAPAAGPGFPSASTAYSWRDSRNVNRANLNLLEDGFIGGSSSINSDRVVEQGGGNFHYVTTSGSPFWTGSLTAINPGKAYWILNRHPGNTWIYDYDSDVASSSIETSPLTPTISTVAPDLRSDNGSTISGSKAPAKTPVSSTTSKTTKKADGASR